MFDSKLETPVKTADPSRFSYAVRMVMVVAAVLLSAHCTRPAGDSDEGQKLTADETYLVDAYVRITEARNLYDVNPFKSESLFARLDSTIDTLRIANTIQALNRDPDRWLSVFSAIERRVSTSQQGQD